MFFTKPLATRLAELAKRDASELEKSYRNTIYCNASLRQEGGKILGTYCGNRWCITCSRIRTALAMARYLPILEAWRDPQFVTLTLRNVPAVELQATIRRMLEGFTAAKRAIKRTDRVAFKALRKLECTYNRVTDEYHPHFHVHVEGRRAAKLLVARWLEYFPDATDERAQKIVAVRDDGSLRELFKYFTKLVSNGRVMPANALDVIFRSMRGHRVYQPVGFVAPKAAADDEGELELDQGTPAFSRAGEELTWEWNQAASDWVDKTTGECLTGYEPAERFRELVEATPESLGTIRPLEVKHIDVDVARENLRRRMVALERRSSSSETPAAVSKTLQRLLRMSEERARALAAEIVAPADDQLILIRDFSIKARDLTDGRQFM